MTWLDYLIIALTLIVFKWVNHAILAYNGKLPELYDESDLTGRKIQLFLQGLDKRFGSRWLPPFYLTAISLVAWPFLKWPSLDLNHLLRNLYLFLSGMILWKALSQQKDWYRNTLMAKEKMALLATWIALIWYPGFIIAWLYIAIHFLRSWTSALQMILRLLQMFAAFLVAVAIVRATAKIMAWGPMKIQNISCLFLAVVVMASHYVASGWAKLSLRPRWTGWILKNRSHDLAAAAYMWGWWSGQPAAQRSRWIRRLAAGERLNQIFVVAVECAWLFALFNSYFTMALCVATAILHLNTFIKTGIFHWPALLAQTAVFSAIAFMAADTQEALFNVVNGLLGVLIIVTFPQRRKIWDPPRLALWDSPFIGRIDWRVEGMSGAVYALNSQSMGPYARFFGGSLPAFLIPHKIFHRHLGQVSSIELRDAVTATKGDRSQLEELQERFGTLDQREDYANAHDRFLFEYFANYNKARKRRSRIPWWLIAAPPIYFYRSGTDEPFLGQERVARVTVSYREAFFDGEHVLTVRDETVKAIDIPLKKFQI